MAPSRRSRPRRTHIRYEIRSPQVIHEEIDGEVVIINLESGNYYSLRGSGARVWAGVELGADVDAIGADLERSFSGASSTRADVAALLADLEAQGLVRVSDTEPSSSPLPPTNTSAAYDPPVLETFTDMQDLILLDPVHEVDEAQGWPRTKPAA